MLPGDVEELTRRNVEEDRPGLRHLLHRADPDAGEDLTPQREQVGGERVGYALGAAFGQGPAEGVPQGAEDHPEEGARPLLQRQERVGRVAGEEAARLLALKEGLGPAAGAPARI
jgi:hypothetical protein